MQSRQQLTMLHDNFVKIEMLTYEDPSQVAVCKKKILNITLPSQIRHDCSFQHITHKLNLHVRQQLMRLIHQKDLAVSLVSSSDQNFKLLY